MQIPTDHPIAQLLVKPVAGWTISVRTVTLAKPLVTDDGQFTQAVSEVTWSGGRIAPGQFQDFSVSADPLPEGVSQLPFKAIQTYSNGDVVRWIDVPQAGQPEPDHPAPVLTLTSGTGAAPSAAATSSSVGSDGMARGIAIGGVVIGLLGLALGTLSWRRAKALALQEPPPPALDGDSTDMASAAPRVPEPQNGTGSRRAGTPEREALRRRGASSRATRR